MDENSSASCLGFYPLVCTVDLSVWRTVSTSKLSSWRLTTPMLPARGRLVLPQSSPSRTKLDDDVGPGLGWRLHLDHTMFHTSSEQESQQANDDTSSASAPVLMTVPELLVEGTFFNANTVEDFRAMNRALLIQDLMQPVVQSLQDARRFLDQQISCLTEDNVATLETTVASLDVLSTIPHLLRCTSTTQNVVSHLMRFFLLCFADIKSHLFYYNVAIPALRPEKEFILDTVASVPSPLPHQLNALRNVLLSPSTTGGLSQQPGCFGCCVFIRRVGVAAAGERSPTTVCTSVNPQQPLMDAENDNWFRVLLEASCNTLSPLHKLTHPIDNDSCVVPLWLALLSYQREKATQRRESHPRKHLLHWGTIEAMVICLDSAEQAPQVVGWPLRSVLFALGYLGLSGGLLPILLYRSQHYETTAPPHSVICMIAVPDQHAFSLPYVERHVGDSQTRDTIVKGWLKRTATQASRGMTATFIVDLRRHLDPVVAQADSVQLNVHLIQWRLLPTFDPSRLQSLKFLLIGMGTLGCAVARNLIGWGVTTLTLVDNGRVAFSSPVRQVLYTHGDAIARDGRGRLKVFAARERLLEIRPDLVVNAVPLEIPMPGHCRFLTESTDDDSASGLIATAQSLERLIDAHDVVFLLTDSRESRWLPSLMIASRYLRSTSFIGKQTITHLYEEPHVFSTEIRSDPDFSLLNTAECRSAWTSIVCTPPSFSSPRALTVALGFDSFVVLRHGQRRQPNESPLACYFCNDLEAPTDSVSQRSLDQQCTVTRPGLSGIASGIAVELVAALSQHPAAPDPPHTSVDSGPKAAHHSCLGAVPHTIRGNLSGFHLSAVRTEAFQHCICCSEPVCVAYCSAGPQFLVDVVRRSETLEEISGLRGVKQCCRASEVIYFDDLEL